MKERPILFSTNMVRAILEGRKTETRRVITSGNTTGFSVKKDLLDFSKIYPNGSFGVKVAAPADNGYTELWRGQCKWQRSDLLYVRETFTKWDHLKDPDGVTYSYKESYWHQTINSDGEQTCQWYDDSLHSEVLRWKPSIHMPKKAARIWLKVKDVNMERVQEIQEKEAISEGVKVVGYDKLNGIDLYRNYQPKAGEEKKFMFAVGSFKTLWDSINKDRGFGWESNPWVWVVKFEVVSTNGKPEVTDEPR